MRRYRIYEYIEEYFAFGRVKYKRISRSDTDDETADVEPVSWFVNNNGDWAEIYKSQDKFSTLETLYKNII